MIINQKLNSEDILNLNLYIFSQNKKLTYNTVIIAIFSIIASIFSFINNNIVLGIAFLVVGVVGSIVLPYIYKKMIRNNVMKKVQDVEWDINVTIDGDKIYYTFSHEDINNVDPYTFNQILCVNEYKKYIFIKIDTQTILFIKKECVNNLEELQKVLERKLILNNRYFVNLKKDY